MDIPIGSMYRVYRTDDWHSAIWKTVNYIAHVHIFSTQPLHPRDLMPHIFPSQSEKIGTGCEFKDE